MRIVVSPLKRETIAKKVQRFSLSRMRHSSSSSPAFPNPVLLLLFILASLFVARNSREVHSFPILDLPALRRAARQQHGVVVRAGEISSTLTDISEPSASAASTTTTTTQTPPPTTTTAFLPSPSLRELQQRATYIASSFQTQDEYDPMIQNGHLQTILPFFLRDTCNYVPRNQPLQALAQIMRRSFFSKKKKRKDGSSSGAQQQNDDNNGDDDSDDFWWDRERIDTPDGDWFHADTKYAVSRGGTTTAATTNTPTVILMHGLQSNSNSSLSKELARGFNMQGMHCVCLNFRGCSGPMNDKFGGYHLGFTDDLIHYVKLFRERQQQALPSLTAAAKLPPLYLSGFSLGANVVLKCLGELGDKAYLEYGIAGAAVSGAPFDMTKNYKVLAKPGSFHRLVYSNSLLDSLKQRLVDQWDYLYDKYPDVNIDYDAAMSATTIMEYEDEVIAPLYGYDDHIDYYTQTSCVHFLETNAVPTLIVNADDDPFFDPTVWPIDKSRVHGDGGGRAPVRMQRTRSGGHLGFGFHQVDADDERLPNDDDDDDEDGVSGPWPSWASWELARFLNHVHEQEKLIDDSVLIR